MKRWSDIHGSIGPKKRSSWRFRYAARRSRPSFAPTIGAVSIFAFSVQPSFEPPIIEIEMER
jgi:hypothetical protein